MTDNFKQTFNIVRNVGDPKEATTIFGFKVTKEDKVFVQNLTVGSQNYTGFVPILNYGNHFCYELSDRIETKGYPAYMCTCGSFAAFFGSSAYSTESAAQGLVLACYYRHALFSEDTGKFIHKHADGSS